MTKHQKRLSVPKSWPVERKTETFTVKADAGPHGEAGVPLVVLLRDVLEYADSKKEARYALNEGSVLVNGGAVSDEQRPIGMFDIIQFTERGEQYRVFPDEGGRLALTPIDADAADAKLGKVSGKGQVTGGDTQLALHDGQTLQLSDASEYAVNDSVVVGFEDDEIVAHFPYEEGALVTAVRGSHAGEIGEIESIEVTYGSGSNAVVVEQDDGGFETVEEYVVVIDENFTGDDDSASAASGESAESEENGEDGESAESAESDDGGDDE